MSLATISESDVRGTEKRRRERLVIDRLTASGISLETVGFSGNECCFLIDGRKGQRFESLIREMNLGVTVRAKCACLSVTRTATDSPLPSITNVMQALDDADIDVLHLTADLSVLRMVVDESEADRLATLLASFYQPRIAKTA
jgi:hypothetical protein